MFYRHLHDPKAEGCHHSRRLAAARASGSSSRVARARADGALVLPDTVRDSPIRPARAISADSVVRPVPRERVEFFSAEGRNRSRIGPATTARRDASGGGHARASGARATCRVTPDVVRGPAGSGTASEPEASRSRRDLSTPESHRAEQHAKEWTRSARPFERAVHHPDAPSSLVSSPADRRHAEVQTHEQGRSRSGGGRVRLGGSHRTVHGGSVQGRHGELGREPYD